MCFVPWSNYSPNTISGWEEELLPCRLLSLAPWAPACCQESVGMQSSNLHGEACCSRERMCWFSSTVKLQEANTIACKSVWLFSSLHYLFIVILGMEPKALWMLGSCSTTSWTIFPSSPSFTRGITTYPGWPRTFDPVASASEWLGPQTYASRCILFQALLYTPW